MSRAIVPLVVSILIALPLAAAYGGRDLVLPVAGHSVGADGRLFDTALWITNLSSSDTADVTLSFYASGKANRDARTLRLRIAPGHTWAADQIDPTLTGGVVMGAIRVQSSADVLATARTYSRLSTETNTRAVASAFAAIPAQYAFGNGEETTLQGLDLRDSRYKFYVVEVAGEPLAVTASLVDANGRAIAEKRLYVDAHMQLASDAQALFNDVPIPDHALLRLSGLNGDGRIVAAAAQIATESQDATTYEMSFATKMRRIPGWEVGAYVLAAGAVLVAVFWRGRRMKDEV